MKQLESLSSEVAGFAEKYLNCWWIRSCIHTLAGTSGQTLSIIQSGIKADNF
jgi:hypothetical protein